MSYALKEIERILIEESKNMTWDEKDNFIRCLKEIIIKIFGELWI